MPSGRAPSALVHAAAGGVGQLLVQMVKAKGGTVDRDRRLGGQARDRPRVSAPTPSINYREADDLARRRCGAANGGNGVDVAYDGVGKATFDASLASLRPRGLMVLFGGASGQVPPFDIQRLNAAGSLFLTRPTLGSYTATREELLERGTSVLGRHRGGTARASRSAGATRSPTRRRHTTTSRPAAPPASCC